jgi:hypothetical protein
MNTELPQASLAEPWREDHLEFLLAFLPGVAASEHKAVFTGILAREFPIETMRIALRLSEAYREFSGQEEVMAWEAVIQSHLQQAGALT